MKILLNFKPLESTYEGFPYVQLLDNTVVFAELPICIGEFGKRYEKPVLYGNFKGIPTVYEESEVKKILSNLKIFHLKIKENRLEEVDEAEADLHIRLPKDTPVDQLVYDKGEVIWAKPIKDNEEK